MSKYKENIKKMMEETGLSKEDAGFLIKNFLDIFKDNIAMIEKALMEKNIALLKSESHRLKGASANLRLSETSMLAALLEETADKSEPEDLVNIAKLLKNQYEAINDEIKGNDHGR